MTDKVIIDKHENIADNQEYTHVLKTDLPVHLQLLYVQWD